MHFPDQALPPIVIVDDCDDDIFLLRHRLRAGGIAHPVITFNASMDALNQLQFGPAAERAPGLLFTDIKLADGDDAFQFIARLRAEHRWDGMRIVVCTSSNDPADLARALEAGVDGYLIKFPSPDILAEFVHHGPWFAVPHRANGLDKALSA